ncbi:uncharacterized protein G2W53_000674 [Senna tora]|uniref:Uncharacterized protein n=1 Tax=Senna tora TaxID=362788 RepID=A0A834XG65_9FABA|nr:uncharacterized protein G2W53_000674 [Senna tora]
MRLSQRINVRARSAAVAAADEDCGVPELDGAESCLELDGARASDLEPQILVCKEIVVCLSLMEREPQILERSSMAALAILMSQSTAWPGKDAVLGEKKNEKNEK